MEDFASRFIRGFQAGNQQKQQKQAEIERAEDRKLEKVLLQHKLRTMGIEEKLQKRQAQLAAHGQRDGQPESSFPVSEAGFEAQPNAAPSMFGGMKLPGQSFGLEAKRREIAPSLISGVEEYGIPDTNLMPQTAEQKMAAEAARTRAAEMSKGRVTKPGDKFSIGRETIFENPAATRPKSYQSKEVSVGGRPRIVNFDPETGQHFLPGSTAPIPADQVKPYEPPSRSGGGGSGVGGGVGTPPGVDAPLDPKSQDLLAHAGLSYNAFMVLSGKMSQLGRDSATRNRASAEVQAWARKRGMDVSTLASQYKAYNEVLENNIQRYNRTVMAEGEIAASIANLSQAAKDSGLGDTRAVNATKQWLRGELNDPNAAQYAFFLNQLTNDIALYNAASQGRAALQADLDDAKSVVRRGIATGSLQGMQKAITSSVEKMGQVLEGGVNRARRDVWNLFGVGDKYVPSKRGGGGQNNTNAQGRVRYDENGNVIKGGE